MFLKKPIVINVFGGPGAGKCFKKGTEILMADGAIKKVEDIRVGDEVMGPDSEPRTVISLSRGEGELFEISPIRGKPYYATGNHILPLKLNHHCIEKSEFYSVKEFMDLSEWRKKRLKLYRSNCIEFKKREVPIDPYFMGYWLGIENDVNQETASKDNEIIKNAAEAVKDGATLNVLRNLSIPNNKRIPELYKINSRKNRLELLAGLMDANGNLTNGCFEIITKHETLSHDIQFLCRSLGLAAYDSVKMIDGVECHRVSISGDLTNVPVKLNGKKAKPIKRAKNALRTGLRVKSIGLGAFYGFEVDKDHLFLLSDFTVTHNSTTAAGVFNLLKLHGLNGELVTEYAKDLTWEQSLKKLENQYYVFGKQYHRMWRVSDSVDIIVTDSPLILSKVYGIYLGRNWPDCFYDTVMNAFNDFNNVNFYLKRLKHYNPAGRNQTEHEAKELDDIIREVLINNGIEFEDVPGNFQAVNTIVKRILSKINVKPKFLIERVENNGLGPA